MKLLYKHILILLALLSFLPNWAEGQTWIGSNNLVGSGEFYFYDAPSGYSGNRFTSNYPGNGTVYTSIGNIEKVGTDAAWLIINTSHTIELSGTITVTAGTLYIVLNGQILAKTGTGRVATINGGTLVIRDKKSAYGNTTTTHAGSLHSYTIGNITHTNVWYPDNSGTNGSATITGGIITGGRLSANGSNNGGCFLVNGGGYFHHLALFLRLHSLHNIW